MNDELNIKTHRLMLRNVRIEDAEIIYKELGCNQSITKYTGWNPYMTLEATRNKIVEDMVENGVSLFSWIIQCGDVIIGSIGAYDYNMEQASIEIGYSIFERFWGNGFASEATAAVIKFLLEKKEIRTIYAWSHIDNIASRKVLEHVGFVKEQIEKEKVIYKLRLK